MSEKTFYITESFLNKLLMNLSIEKSFDIPPGSVLTFEKKDSNLSLTIHNIEIIKMFLVKDCNKVIESFPNNLKIKLIFNDNKINNTLNNPNSETDIQYTNENKTIELFDKSTFLENFIDFIKNKKNQVINELNDIINNVPLNKQYEKEFKDSSLAISSEIKNKSLYLNDFKYLGLLFSQNKSTKIYYFLFMFLIFVGYITGYIQLLKITAIPIVKIFTNIKNLGVNVNIATNRFYDSLFDKNTEFWEIVDNPDINTNLQLLFSYMNQTGYNTEEFNKNFTSDFVIKYLGLYSIDKKELEQSYNKISIKDKKKKESLLGNLEIASTRLSNPHYRKLYIYWLKNHHNLTKITPLRYYNKIPIRISNFRDYDFYIYTILDKCGGQKAWIASTFTQIAFNILNNKDYYDIFLELYYPGITTIHKLRNISKLLKTYKKFDYFNVFDLNPEYRIEPVDLNFLYEELLEIHESDPQNLEIVKKAYETFSDPTKYKLYTIWNDYRDYINDFLKKVNKNNFRDYVKSNSKVNRDNIEIIKNRKVYEEDYDEFYNVFQYFDIIQLEDGLNKLVEKELIEEGLLPSKQEQLNQEIIINENKYTHDDYYRILDLKPKDLENKTKEEIEKFLSKKYRKKSIEYHPDKGGDPNTFDILNSAKEILGDSKTKEFYDSWLKHKNFVKGKLKIDKVLISDFKDWQLCIERQGSLEELLRQVNIGLKKLAFQQIGYRKTVLKKKKEKEKKGQEEKKKTILL